MQCHWPLVALSVIALRPSMRLTQVRSNATMGLTTACATRLAALPRHPRLTRRACMRRGPACGYRPGTALPTKVMADGFRAARVAAGGADGIVHKGNAPARSPRATSAASLPSCDKYARASS